MRIRKSWTPECRRSRGENEMILFLRGGVESRHAMSIWREPESHHQGGSPEAGRISAHGTDGHSLCTCAVHGVMPPPPAGVAASPRN